VKSVWAEWEGWDVAGAVAVSTNVQVLGWRERERFRERSMQDPGSSTEVRQQRYSFTNPYTPPQTPRRCSSVCAQPMMRAL
jgi:hypothetical protein